MVENMSSFISYLKYLLLYQGFLSFLLQKSSVPDMNRLIVSVNKIRKIFLTQAWNKKKMKQD